MLRIIYSVCHLSGVYQQIDDDFLFCFVFYLKEMNVTGLLRVDMEPDEARSPGLVPFLELSTYFLVHFLSLTAHGVIIEF